MAGPDSTAQRRRYERDCAEFERLLAAGDVAGARAVITADGFSSSLTSASVDAALAGAKEAETAGISRTTYHAFAGHVTALVALRRARTNNAVLRATVAALEARMAEVEAKGVVYRGVYQRSDDYKRGDLVSHSGAIWHAVGPTRQIPGTGDDWQLAVKSHR